MLFTFLLLSYGSLYGESLYGERQKISREYWDNGKLKKETHFKNGKEEGRVTVWYKNGKSGTDC